MKLVVVESPYAGDIERNVAYARRAIRSCLMRGEAPFASHLLYTQEGGLDDNDEIERQFGIECGLAWAERAALTVFYTDLGWSPGMLYTLHNFNLKRNYPFRIRALDAAPQLPATLDEDLKALLRCYVEE